MATALQRARSRQAARARRATRSRGLHQAGRDIFAKYLRLLPHAARAAAHDAFDIAPYRYDTTVKADTTSGLCLRFVLPADDGCWLTPAAL